jgi:hypothetical protein
MPPSSSLCFTAVCAANLAPFVLPLPSPHIPTATWWDYVHAESGVACRDGHVSMGSDMRMTPPRRCSAENATPDLLECSGCAPDRECYTGVHQPMNPQMVIWDASAGRKRRHQHARSDLPALCCVLQASDEQSMRHL